jgi:hypothetical protein
LDSLCDIVFVRPPGNSYARCVSSKPERDYVDVTLAKDQHVAAKELGVKAWIDYIGFCPFAIRSEA